MIFTIYCSAKWVYYCLNVSNYFCFALFCCNCLFALQRVLLLVHLDVDAVCTCKILQGLFKSDNIVYTLIPVGGISDLKTAYEENHEEIKYVVLVNCGGTIDLVDILQPEEDVVFFILDSHKPSNVSNVYSDGQVSIKMH